MPKSNRLSRLLSDREASFVMSSFIIVHDMCLKKTNNCRTRCHILAYVTCPQSTSITGEGFFQPQAENQSLGCTSRFFSLLTENVFSTMGCDVALVC